jgi:transcriptional regulator with PAS, ATPase and Fis domain
MPPEGPWNHSTSPNAPVSTWGAPELELLVVHPPELAGARFRLSAGLCFGRAPEDGTACLPHPTISRRHAVVRAGMGGLLLLEDLQSRNGTKVDGQRPELPLPLKAQSVVRLGDVHAVVDVPSVRDFAADSVLPGSSALVAQARQKLDQTAAGSAPVLILGETGTGKERVAHEVHRLSGRSGRYVTLNCAELSPQLIESQLFGHERGAFTGASAAQAGLFAAAHGGTLFLDEIGELRLDLQPKLLRVLQEGEVRRLGSVSAERVDVRVVAATHRDLPALVEADAFRRDLFARLSFHEVRLPSLRERRQDVLPWLRLLAARYGQERGVRFEPQLAPDAVERLLLFAWPDNLRGLDRLVHRLGASDGVVGLRVLADAMPELVGPERGSEAPAPVARQASSTPPIPLPSREELLAAYEASGRSVRATAKHFGRDRRQIYRWLERFGVPREDNDD